MDSKVPITAKVCTFYSKSASVEWKFSYKGRFYAFVCQSTFFSLVVEELSAQVASSAGVATQQSGSTGTRNVYSLFIHTYIKHNSCDLVNAMDQKCKV